MEPLDLLQILMALKKRIIFIIFAALLGGLLSYGYTVRFVTPMYQASIQMIVNARPETVNTASQTTVGDINSAQSLVATYATVIKSNRVMEHVDKTLGLNMGWKRINSMVTVRPVDDTPVINIIVTCSDPELARKIVTAISEFAPEKIVEAVEAGSCRVISDADCSSYPISPDITANVQKGMLLGAALCAALVVLLMRQLLKEMEDQYDYILPDCPPVLSVSDPAILSSMCDGVVFVVRQGKIRKKQYTYALSMLETVNARMLGVILGMYETKSDHSYGYGYGRGYYYRKYGYGYGYGYGHSKKED